MWWLPLTTTRNEQLFIRSGDIRCVKEVDSDPEVDHCGSRKICIAWCLVGNQPIVYRLLMTGDEFWAKMVEISKCIENDEYEEEEDE